MVEGCRKKYKNFGRDGKSDFLYATVTKLRSLYDEVGLRYTYRESEGNHTWHVCRLYLTELAPKFFK